MKVLEKLKSLAEDFHRERKVYQLVLKDECTPKLGALFLGLGLFYLLMPLDLIPDWIPVLGYLDDVIIIPILVGAAIKIIPKEIIEDCRQKVASEEIFA